ncbi:polysaccharide deacetylase family protein [Verrucomicrobia bacterium]|nr:polysaccharide deacetylase family protein [Verrucomicrobiota bacterium]
MKLLLVIVSLSIILTSFCASALAGQANVFIYHRFDEARYPSTNISADVFRQQLEYLKTSGIDVVSAEEIVQALGAGEPLPERAAAITVDDAFSSFYEVAMPILKEYGFPTTLFVNTDSVGASGYMTWEQIRSAVDQGVAIGHHTAAHPYLVEKEGTETDSQWHQRILQDLGRAQQAFIEELGFEPQLFAYTYGEYTPQLVDLIKEFGFSGAFAQQSGVVWEGDNRFVLPRFPMGGPFATYEGFLSKLKMKALQVEEVSLVDPIIRQQNPPLLRLKLKSSADAKRHFNCFAQGDNSCTVRQIPGQEGWIEVQAEKPLTGRRNKYTLTMQPASGGWAWYSQLWVNANSPVAGLTKND